MRSGYDNRAAEALRRFQLVNDGDCQSATDCFRVTLKFIKSHIRIPAFDTGHEGLADAHSAGDLSLCHF